MKTSSFYQTLFEYSLGIRKSKIPKFRGICYKLFEVLKKRHRKFKKNNIFISFKRNNVELVTNTTHEILFVFPNNKLYSTNLGRLCKYISTKYPSLSVIDIGANIGDSLFLIKEKIDCPVLCIEGNKEFVTLLKYNAGKFNNVEVEDCLVGSQDAQKLVSAISNGYGTSFFADSSNIDTEQKKYDPGFLTVTNLDKYEYKSLSTIIGLHPNFKIPKLLKIDTDGFDCEIIRGNIEFISQIKPIVFFEYAPFILKNGKDSEYETFEILKNNGYGYLMIYSSSGELFYCCNNELNNTKFVHEYFSRTKRYCDVAAFHNDDSDLYKAIGDLELEFMKNIFN